MSALPSSRKTHSEKHKQIFRQLLKELPNKSCVDCKTAQHPRWASWNLGCFICIRCSGIHRSMGTHISRVKSVDLDVWTDEQVESMIKWGNEKCNAYWEAKLPDNYVPDASKIENFIRTKYDMRKWAASSKVPDPMSISVAKSAVSDPQTSTHNGLAKAPVKPVTNTQKTAANGQSHVSASAPSLLDDDFGAFASSTSAVSMPSPAQRPRGSFSAASSAGISSRANSAQPASPATPVAPSPRVNDVRNDLKKSILSLYSSPSSSTSSVHQPQQNHRNAQTSSPHTPQMSGAHPGSVAGLSSSLTGLSFDQRPANAYASPSASTPKTNTPTVNTPSANTPSANTPSFTPKSGTPSVVPGHTPQWANEWNDSASSANQWTGAAAYNGTSSSILDSGFSGTFGARSNGVKATTTDLDDDLFKNVWD